MTENGQRDLLLIALPWAQADNLCIQIASLKAYAVERGIRTQARHYYRDLHAYVPDAAVYALREANAGEFVSLRFLHPERSDVVDTTVAALVEHCCDLDELYRGFDRFLDDCVADIERLAVPGRTVLGFSTSLQQIVTTLVVTARLKARSSDYETLIGGAILVPEVAVDLLRAYHQLDLAIYGEGEEALVTLLTSDVLGNVVDNPALTTVPNLVHRLHGDVVANSHNEMAKLATLPVPDYSDYVEHELRPGAVDIYPKVSVETSRGCFYDKCEFCNLNAQWAARYRAKSDDQIHRELLAQVERYRTARVLFVDTNISNRARLFRRMADDPVDYHCWGEVSGHLNRSAFLAMRAAGVRDIQIGIESFSSSMLKKFAKGVSAMRNMEMLKWCAQLGIKVFYNLIVESPEETAEDVEENLRGMRFAMNFAPPALAPYVLTLDSPYDRGARDGSGITLRTEIPPHIAAMLPEESVEVLGRLLLTFVGTRPAVVDDETTARVREAARQWQERWEANRSRPGMVVRRGLGFVALTRRHGDDEEHVVLGPPADAVYLACMDEARTVDEIARAAGIPPVEADSLLRALEQLELAFHSDGMWLALGCWGDEMTAAARFVDELVSVRHGSAESHAKPFGTTETVIELLPARRTASS